MLQPAVPSHTFTIAGYLQVRRLLISYMDTPEDFGETEEFDDDEESDIADETPGHRG